MKRLNHRERRGHGGPKRRSLVVLNEMFSDPITRAIARNGELRRVVFPMECESAEADVFRCVCCGKVRGDAQRREHWSEVCVKCVEEAGFFN